MTKIEITNVITDVNKRYNINLQMYKCKHISQIYINIHLKHSKSVYNMIYIKHYFNRPQT